MSRKFFYNNNHVYQQIGDLKTILKRDFSGHYGVMCDMCKEEMHGKPNYSIRILKTQIVSTLNGIKTVEKLSKNSNKKRLQLMGHAGLETDFCNTCIGKMKDWKEKFDAK